MSLFKGLESATTETVIRQIWSLKTRYNSMLIEFLEKSEQETDKESCREALEEFLRTYRQDLEFLFEIYRVRKDTILLKAVGDLQKLMDKVFHQVCLSHIARWL